MSSTIVTTLYFVQAIALLIIGAWTRKGGAAIGAIVTTQGNDISLLMQGMRELRRIYSLQRGLLIAVLVISFLIGVITGVMEKS